DAAAAAGVVPVVAAGNDYNDVGAGSVSSPANSARAITVGAVEVVGNPGTTRLADFSSVGPTTMSLRLKPDVAAPGVGILSSVPNGGWSAISGTSMAAPHIAGAVALLRQRHPRWTVAQVKSALVQTGTDVVDGGSGSLGPQFQGGGVVSLPAANQPLLFAQPSGVSFGLVGRGARTVGSIALGDAGGGTGSWQVRELRPFSSTGRADLVLPASVDVPGSLAYELVTPTGAAQGDVSGFIELRRGTDVRRIPFWGRVAVPALGRHAARALVRPGVFRGTTRGRPALVTRYRYPENPRGVGVTTMLRGPELVYRFRLTRAAVNFGVVVTQQAPGVRVEPRVVARMDENRLTGYAGLPVHHNPYLEGFRSPVPAAGALSPRAGEYAIVFDSATRAGAGRFTFRFWVNDVTPPTLRVRSRTVNAGSPFLVGAADAGSGVYPASIRVTVGGRAVRHEFRNGVIRIPTVGLTRGTHRLQLRVSDYQETKNTENVRRILPNTRILSTTFTVR
ncbi:MAG TPA: S8 family serine peptidase, partial [Gaiellaceae bacterium]|nr:S8 family serine peptidase [Gaiellaceae bacterium]